VVLVVVVVAATGVVTILNAAGIIANVKVVADIAMTLFSFLLLKRFIISQARIQAIKEFPWRILQGLIAKNGQQEWEG
jgi:hypothetical protein